MSAKRSQEEVSPEGDQDFDARVARLEALVREMEQGGLGLEGAIGRYEEGVALLARCREELAGYRKQVEELSRGTGELSDHANDPDLRDED